MVIDTTSETRGTPSTPVLLQKYTGWAPWGGAAVGHGNTPHKRDSRRPLCRWKKSDHSASPPFSSTSTPYPSAKEPQASLASACTYHVQWRARRGAKIRGYVFAQNGKAPDVGSCSVFGIRYVLQPMHTRAEQGVGVLQRDERRQGGPPRCPRCTPRRQWFPEVWHQHLDHRVPTVPSC